MTVGRPGLPPAGGSGAGTPGPGAPRRGPLRLRRSRLAWTSLVVLALALPRVAGSEPESRSARSTMRVAPTMDRSAGVGDAAPAPRRTLLPQEGGEASAPAPASAWGLAVDGSDYAYLRTGAATERLQSYSNVGYRLVVRPAEDGGTEVIVEVDLSPLEVPQAPGSGAADAAPEEAGASSKSRGAAGAGGDGSGAGIGASGTSGGAGGRERSAGTATLPAAPGDSKAATASAPSTAAGRTASPPGGGREAPPEEVPVLARRLTADAVSPYEAVSAVLGWMVHNVVSAETAALGPRPRRPLGGGGDGAGAASGSEAVAGRSTSAGSPGSGSPRSGTPGGGGPGPGGPGSDESGSVGSGSGGAASRAAGSGGAGSAAAAPPRAAVPRPSAPPSGSPAASASPQQVLERGSGSAEEVARLAVALLQAAGFEARTVEGRVVGLPEVGSPWGPHTWIEVRYPGRGWVFSDPLYHHHYVPATYVRLTPAAVQAAGKAVAKAVPGGKASGAGEPAADAARPAAAPGEALALRLVERRDRRETVDLYRAGTPGVTARKDQPRQKAGALRVVVAGDGRGSAVLEGEEGRRSKILVAGESVFVGLQGGDYRLEVYLEGRPPIVRELKVGAQERRAIYLRDPREARTGGPAPPAVRRQDPTRNDGRRSRP